MKKSCDKKNAEYIQAKKINMHIKQTKKKMYKGETLILPLFPLTFLVVHPKLLWVWFIFMDMN